MGVLEVGAVLAVEMTSGESVPAAEREAYHAALVTLAGEDRGRSARSWRAREEGKDAAATPPRKRERR